MSFVEEATLVTKDKTSSVIKAINKELLIMRKRADDLKSIKMDFNNTVLNNRLTSTTKKFERLAEAAKKASAAISGAKLPAPRVPSYVQTIQKQLAAQSLAASAKELHGIKGIRIEFDMPGLTAAMTETGMLLSNVRGLKKFSAVKLNVNSAGPTGSGYGSSGISLNIKPLQTMLHGFLLNLGYTIQNSIIAGFAAGTTTQDVAESRLMFQGMTDAQITMINQAVREIVRDNPQLSTPNATALVSEMLTTAQGDPAVAVQMARLAAEMVKTQTILGMQPKQAEEQALGLIKSAETGGFLTDAKTGKYDPVKANAYFDVLTKSAIAIGEEFGAKMVGGFLKYAQTSKFPLDERGLIGGFLASEESGTSAGVGLNQAIKQLSGERITKKNLARMQDLGLITVTEIEAAKASAMSPDELTFAELFSKGAQNEEELRSNFYGWVRSTIIPTMVRGGMDPNNPQDAAKFAGAVTSDRTATNALSSAIIRSQEIEVVVTKTVALDASKERINQVENQSLTASIGAVTAQFESTLGAVGNSFENILIPALNATSSALMALTNFISGEDGRPSATRSMVALGGVGAATIGGGMLLKKGLSWLNPLSLAGTTLTTAGNSLIVAAASLERAAFAAGGGNLGTAPGAAAAAGGAAGWFSKSVSLLSKSVGAVLMGYAASTAIGGGAVIDVAENTRKREAYNAANNLPRDFRPTLMGIMSDWWNGTAKAPTSKSSDGMSDLVSNMAQLDVSGHLDSSAERMRGVFNTGADQISQASKDSGSAAGQEMMAAAPAIGNAIGQAAAAVLAGMKLGVRQTAEQRSSPSYVPPQRADTGAMTPF